MFGSETIEIGIGLALVFMLVSLMCSAIREAIESLLKTRAVYLERGIRELLHDREGTGLAKSFYTHPLINGLFSADMSGDAPKKRMLGRGLPSYVPARNFALALMDMAARGTDPNAAASSSSPVMSLESIRSNVDKLQNPAVQRILLTAIDTAQGDLNRAQAAIESWFDSSMDRVSGWYKRSTQYIVFAIALTIAIGLNVDAIRITGYLSQNKTAREAIVAIAEKTGSGTTGNGSAPSETWNQAKQQLDSLRLPIGWAKPNPNTPSGGPSDNWSAVMLVGWLLTAFAATLGAPFWFDVLNRLMVIRATVKPHEKSPEEASEDRQKPSAGTQAQPQSQVQPETAPPTPGASAADTSPPPDPESDVDGCEVAVSDLTNDEDLPPSEGGVA